MPSFNGRKSGEGDQAAVLAAMPYAQQQAYIHAQRLKATGVTSGRWYGPLPNGGSMVSIIYESGLAEILVYPPGAVVPTQVPAILDYYSGLVFGGNLNKASALDLITAYGETREDPPPIYKLYSFFPSTEATKKFPVELPTPFASTKPVKLAVEQHLDFSSFPTIIPIKSVNTSPSQYAFIRPSLFYGTMRKVVQFVLGIGKVIHPTWYEANVPFTPPEDVVSEVPMFDADELETYRSTTSGDRTVQLTYDFRYNNSYGVYKEQVEGGFTWWIIRINQALGVIAMPLPVDYASTLPEFREALVNAKDENGVPLPVEADLKVLDTFGGFPTGAGFEKQVEAYIRAGVYVRLAKIEDMPDYVGFTWGSQTGWAFNYDGNVAKVVAYEDIDMGMYDQTHYAMCRAVRDMSIEIKVATADPFVSGPYAQNFATAIAGYIPTEGIGAKPWLVLKLGRLTEEQALPLLLQYNAVAGDKGEVVERILAALEMLEATPIGAGTAVLAVEGQWAFNPPVTLFKPAELRYDMCPSVDWPAMTILVPSGDFKVVVEGEKVPLVRFFTETGDEKVIWYDSGKKDHYYDLSTTPDTKVEYQSLTACCYVDVQPTPAKAKNQKPNSYYEYKATGLKYTHSHAWAGNDYSPEGYYRDDWVLQRLTTGKDDGGLSKAVIQYGSAYVMFGDNEAALEFRYTHTPSIPSHTVTYSRTTTGSTWSYDYYWVDFYYLGPPGPDPHGEVTCYLVDGVAPGNWCYCHQPEDGVTYVGGDWVGPDEVEAGGAGVFNGASNLGSWAKPEDRLHYLFGDAPAVPANETVPATAASSEMRTTLYMNGVSAVTKTDNTYVPRSLAFFDILELQRSQYDPPPESPYVEHDVRGSSNCFGVASASAMQGVNDYTHHVFGTQLQSGQQGDQACFVGVILD